MAFSLSSDKVFFPILGHLLIIIGIILYNEIITVHLFKLDRNTNKEVMGRAKEINSQEYIVLLAQKGEKLDIEELA